MTAPTTQVSESQIVERIMEVLDQTDRNSFLEIANNALGTDFEIEDVEWGS